MPPARDRLAQPDLRSHLSTILFSMTYLNAIGSSRATGTPVNSSTCPPFVKKGEISMVTRQRKRAEGRKERHSAAWGKRLSSVLVVVLATGIAFGQRLSNPTVNGRLSRIAPELSDLLSKAKQGSAKTQTIRVIVQYKQVPTSAHYATMQGRGARLHTKLHMIKGAAFTIPVSALPALEADPNVVSVTIDHPMNVMDDITDNVIGAS